MHQHIEEASYPLSFRRKDSQLLGLHIKNRHSVVLVGMKRVGISNFLRFFLFRNGITKKYIDSSTNHLFIPIDLNDLVERELFPFWVLTLKRIEDAVNRSDVSKKTKDSIEELFLDSIQSQDLFLTIDAIRKSLSTLVDEGYMPTLFFLRFDRMQDVITPEFFANLQGLIDACHQKLSYVFTSVRSLEFLSPTVFTKASVSVFARTMHIQPSLREDSVIVADIISERLGLALNKSDENKLLNLTDGYNQYLQFALNSLNENRAGKVTEQTLKKIESDERIVLQSEELWESLTEDEKEVLISFLSGKKISHEQKEKAEYLWDTGFIKDGKIFSPLFEEYVIEKGRTRSDSQKKELSKKEHMLLNILESNRGGLCERELIIETVWPEAESYGVSDWAVDRLVARLRQKIKDMDSDYEIVTVKTRGYKLV